MRDLTTHTRLISILSASASNAFSINSLTTAYTEVIICVVVISFAVFTSSAEIGIFQIPLLVICLSCNIKISKI